MIDIIIPAFNSHDTIVKTLANIRLQTIYNLATIYIVDDCSDYGYSKEISYFKDELNIIEIKTPYNMGPGAARQYAIDRSNGDYIVFMDADDQFYNAYILNKLYYEIHLNNSDMAYGLDYSEKIMKTEIDSMGSLHGKIYRRSFLEKNKIRFNNTRYSEDDSFNKIVMYTSNKVIQVPDITYLYLNNEHSITGKLNKSTSILKNYIYNMIWTALELKKKKVSNKKIASFLIKSFTYAYKKIIESDDVNLDVLYFSCYRFEEIFSEYEKYMNNDDIVDLIKAQISWQYQWEPKDVLENFNVFRKRCKCSKIKYTVDIIIYASNSHKKIIDTLLSIVIQKYDFIKVYLVNDNSAKDYKEEVNKFKDLINIKELDLKETIGRNAAMQYAIDHSKSDYITFIEAGDIFNDGLAIKKMIDIFKNSKGAKDDNIAAGVTLLNIQESNIFSSNNGSYEYIYGKLYKRSFLKKNKIKLPTKNNNIDYFFNLLISNIGILGYSEQYSYIKRYDEFSSLKFNDYKQLKKLKDIEDYSFGICWIVDSLEKLKKNKDLIVNFIYNALYKIYYYYIPFNNTEIGNKILINLGKLKEYYLKYKNEINENEKLNIMVMQYQNALVNLNTSTYQKNLIPFDDFINKISVDN